MHSMALPILSGFAVAAITVVAMVDSRSRSILNWLIIPVLVEGAAVFWYFSRV